MVMVSRGDALLRPKPSPFLESLLVKEMLGRMGRSHCRHELKLMGLEVRVAVVA